MNERTNECFVAVDYVRTGAAFSIIAILLSSGSNFFTWYSINEPRYMFKRVAGSLHLITGKFTYTVCQKNTHADFLCHLWRKSTDFNNSFTIALRDELQEKLEYNLLTCPKYVAALPCET